MRTDLGRLGVPPHIAEFAINHAKGDVEAIYDRHRISAKSRPRWRFGPSTCSHWSKAGRTTSSRCSPLKIRRPTRADSTPRRGLTLTQRMLTRGQGLAARLRQRPGSLAAGDNCSETALRRARQRPAAAAAAMGGLAVTRLPERTAHRHPYRRRARARVRKKLIRQGMDCG